MLMEKAVVATNCDPLQRIINESNSGLTYISNDEYDLADKITQLHSNNSLLKQMGKKWEKSR